MTKRPFEKGYRSNELLRIIHSDVYDLLNIKIYNHNEYFVIFIFDFFRYCYIYLICNKAWVFACFKRYKMEVEKLFERNIKALRIVRSVEYYLEF
jgi:hypothetical protein